jgi:hypothetical protein
MVVAQGLFKEVCTVATKKGKKKSSAKKSKKKTSKR